jgi:predicted phage replisome organizer
MADVKWIKMDTGLLDNKKIKQIRKLPNGDTIALMWVFMMCLAGDVNEQGLIYITPEVPYTDEMLAEEFRMDVNTIRLGLATFQRFGMIEIIDDIMCVSNWEKWQSVDRLSEIREYNRLAKQKSRAKQKLLASVNDKSMTSQPCHDTDKDIEVEEDKDIDIDKDKKSKKKSKKEDTLTLFNRLSSDYLLSQVLEEKLVEWFTYKTERKDSYQEQGMKSLLRRIENSKIEYGEQAVCDLIDESMANGWKGIIFDRLSQKQSQRRAYEAPREGRLDWIDGI